MSKSLVRLEDRFARVEADGAQLIEQMRTNTTKLRTLRERRDLGTSLPGRLGKHPKELETLLEHRLACRVEGMFEQLRLCLVELEVLVQQMQAALLQINEEKRLPRDEQIIYNSGQEYWRKRQLLEVALSTDTEQTIGALGDAWMPIS